VESNSGTGAALLLVLVSCDADSDGKVSEECGRILFQVERVVWSIGQPLSSDLWSTGHLLADMAGGSRQ